jgi:hypothetical protein
VTSGLTLHWDHCAFAAGALHWIPRIVAATRPAASITSPEKAAKAVGGILVKPWFPSSRPRWAMDFNGQYKLCGIDQGYDTFNLALI